MENNQKCMLMLKCPTTQTEVYKSNALLVVNDAIGANKKNVNQR